VATQALRIRVDGNTQVSALLELPRQARACYVMAHGAGAGMEHPFMTATAQGLAERGIATLRFQFPYMERGARRPDAAPVAHAAVRAAVAEAQRRMPTLPLYAGGKSFGGRMTSQAQAAEPMPAVRGLIFLGFPLHPTGHPGTERAQHLFEVRVPALFLQGTRDALAEMPLMRSVAAKLGQRATLKALEGADHAFHVLVRSGRKDAEVMSEMLDAICAWIAPTNP
jgi:predicted alpha/beta-hydrolase family hydrolase